MDWNVSEVGSFGSVLSIGSHCLTSMQVKLAGLKLFSGPFDWIFSNLAMVDACIEDGFASFLNPALHALIPPAQRPDATTRYAEHLVFGQLYGLQPIFNHFDPTLPEQLAYLRRCVCRFKAALAAPTPQLLLAICYPGQDREREFERLAALLQNTRAAAWVMILHENRERPGITVSRQIGVHRLLDLCTTSLSDGVNFRDNADNLWLQEYLRSMIQLDPACDPRRTMTSLPSTE